MFCEPQTPAVWAFKGPVSEASEVHSDKLRGLETGCFDHRLRRSLTPVHGRTAGE